MYAKPSSHASPAPPLPASKLLPVRPKPPAATGAHAGNTLGMGGSGVLAQTQPTLVALLARLQHKCLLVVCLGSLRRPAPPPTSPIAPPHSSPPRLSPPTTSTITNISLASLKTHTCI
ncbi:hypothetical protein E2C01_074660 [Portunus trituberculatus]|uniref:Uncharacterized protein n=1 Tax=Portunus trituberculatus TaxID=210409 RepID=A0A5B7ICU4_PORTR|nr:hypothetical protein [Portunus trituberculatus]